MSKKATKSKKDKKVVMRASLETVNTYISENFTKNGAKQAKKFLKGSYEDIDLKTLEFIFDGNKNDMKSALIMFNMREFQFYNWNVRQLNE